MVCIFNLFLKINQSVSLFSTEFIVIFEHNIFLFRFLFYRQMTQRVLSCPVFSDNTTLLQAGGPSAQSMSVAQQNHSLSWDVYPNMFLKFYPLILLLLCILTTNNFYMYRAIAFTPKDAMIGCLTL